MTTCRLLEAAWLTTCQVGPDSLILWLLSDCRSSVAAVNSYLFIPPSRYVFPGAEVYDAAPAADTDDDEIDFLKESSDWSALVE